MDELTPVDPQDGVSKKKIFIAIGALIVVAILAWAVFIAPSSGTKGFIKTGEPYTGSAQPYTSTPNPFSASAQPYSESAQPYTSTPNPFSASAQPYSESAQPFTPSPEPFIPSALSANGQDCDAWVAEYQYKRAALVEAILTYNDTIATLTGDAERMKANIVRDREYTNNMITANKYYDDGHVLASLTYQTVRDDFDAFAATKGECSI